MLDIKAPVIILISYGLGCIATAYYLIYFRVGDDIRAYGSGNVGARNAGRVLGAWGFVVAFGGDVAKGVVAVGLARYVGLGNWGLALATIAVVVGHIWPIQLRFRGGKGLATALGAMLLYKFWLMIMVVVVCGLILLILRRSTASALLAVLIAPFIAVGLGYPLPTEVAVTVLAILTLFAHRSNIRNILNDWRQTSNKHTFAPEQEGE